MSLLALSEELLLKVVSHVSSPRDAAALSRQCRRLHGLCDMETRREYQQVSLGSPDELETGFKMLLSILRKPRLGDYLNHLQLTRSPDYNNSNNWGIENNKPSGDSIGLSQRDLQMVEEAISHAGFREIGIEKDVLKSLLPDGKNIGNYGEYEVPCAHALAALLVSVAPNLQSLAFAPVGFEYSKRSRGGEPPDSEAKHYYFKRFMDRANTKVGEIPYLQNLRDVKFLSETDNYMNDGRFYEEYDVYGALNLVRRLPAIESVTFKSILEPEEGSVCMPPNSANFSKIRLLGAMLDWHMHRDVIETAKQLKEFVLTTGGRASPDGSSRIFNPEQMLRSLLLHRRTLQHLDLNIEGAHGLSSIFDSNEDFEDDPEDLPDEDDYKMEWEDELDNLEPHDTNAVESLEFPSLQHFTGLKHLALGTHLLYFFARGIGNNSDHNPETFSLADHLPKNLESLRIYGYDKGKVKNPYWNGPELHLDGHIAKFMAEKDKLPFLKVIEGVDEYIPNDEMVEDPDNHPELLW